MASTDPLLQPFRIRHLTLKNRIFSSSHEPAYSDDGKPKRRYRLYHEEKARGGVALTQIGGSTLIAPDSPPAFGNLYAGDDDIIPYLRDLVDGIHEYGCAVTAQITHLGRRTSWDTGHWLPTVSASPVREPAHRSFPKEAEAGDIRRIVKAYGAAARRCRDGGLDGVEVEAYGHFLDSFWSPATNRRNDAYGGSLENRMRFSLEVLEEVRKQVGGEYIVGIRMVMDEDMEGGLGAEEGLEIARRLVATGMLDFLSVIRGHIDTDEGLSHVIPNMGTPAAPHLDFAGRIKREFDIPILHAARIADLATARHAIAEGLLDMVGMTRAHMADPHIVAKLMRGEEDRIRPCVGAGYCIDRIYVGNEALCLHNPATGREETVPHEIPPADAPGRRVVIIGAGPAGLEAARVSALRGHDVVLLEAAGRTGGQVVLAAKAPRRGEIIGITDWLAGEVERLGVDVRLNTYAEAADVVALDPDVVIVATGGLPNSEFVEGHEHVTSVWDILGGHAQAAGEVLVFDDHGAHQGLSAAALMAARGARVEIVTPDRMIAAGMGGTNSPAYLKDFYARGVVLTPDRRLIAVRREANRLVATLRNEYTFATEERTVDQVVVEHGTLPADGLYLDLGAGSSNLGEVDLDALIAGRPQGVTQNADGAYQLFRVGDAVASRDIHAAIYDSLRLCKDL